MSKPEGLYLQLDEDSLTIRDAQDVAHISFSVANGDPCAWSRNMVTAVCRSMGVTRAMTSDGDYIPIGKAIRLWHKHIGSEDGFIH